MQLTYDFNINSNSFIHSLCLVSNNLYNQANYIVKRTLNEEKRWVRYNELDRVMKETKTLEGKMLIILSFFNKTETWITINYSFY